MIKISFNVIGEKIIEHRSPMQTEQSQLSGQRIMPETRFGSTDNAENEVNLVSGIILLPLGWISRSASESDDRFYFVSVPENFPTYVLKS